MDTSPGDLIFGPVDEARPNSLQCHGTSCKMHDLSDPRDGLGRMGRFWDGLGRIVGRIECEKYPMFTGLGTVGRIKWGIRYIGPKPGCMKNEMPGLATAELELDSRHANICRDS